MKIQIHKPRLARLDRYYFNSPLFFLTICTHHRRRILNDPGIHQAFVTFSQQAEERGMMVGRYVLMPDHIHLFAGIAPNLVTVSDGVRYLKKMLSKVIQQKGLSPPHWQKGFFDHVLRSSESYSGKWEYVVQNPVRAGLVLSPEEWPYQGEIHVLPFE